MAPPAIGGVCAHLDYEVDQMADYVAEMAQRIVMGNAPVTPAFRKFCSGLLSSTRLPSTTILLGMNYLARRMNGLNATGLFKATDGQVWRMLTIGLLLGSKFLDDNTFQNRSWSEVSGIPVAELNTLENEWLISMDWKLYVNLDESQDFQAWMTNWSDWRQLKNVQRSNTLERLAPRIDTESARVQAQYGAKYSTGHPNPQIRDSNRYDPFYDQPKTNWHQYPTPHCTPPTNRNSALNSPLEQMSATGGASRYTDWSLYSAPGYSRGYQQQTAYMASMPRVVPYHTPFSGHYAHQYNGNLWESHGSNCTGDCCTQQVKQPFFYSGYGQQITA